MQFDAVLLDLDGTLLDTIPDLADATNAMRESLGMSRLPDDVIATYVGKGTTVLVERALANNPQGIGPSAEALAAGLDSFHHHYHTINGRRAALYPGVLEGLQAFQGMGVKLAVVTNKPTEFTLPLLAHCGLAPYFAHVVCGDTCARKKPDPMPLLHACELLGVAPGQALAIGDSVNDAQAAQAAGMAVLAVPYGYNEGRDVRELDVDDIVATIADAAGWAANRQPQTQNT
ncbi:phosphoglycolate phosphatase [Paracandidimonas lactea]|uniref:phosphoglycolate phosphatase n=1 Tax=Paracandidimonas lactea TaxID=2895524 RepID=UPI001F02AF00|nr:phosphoglycolate phosphatase [Paracandidimonas lactea]